MNIKLTPKEHQHRHMNTLNTSKCAMGSRNGVRGGGGGARKGEKGRKDIFWRSVIHYSAGLSPPPHPIYCLRAMGDEWQIRRDDLESESASRWQTRNSSLSSQELDRLMRVKITSLDFRYKTDFPYLWNAVTYGVKASQYTQGPTTLTIACIK